MMKLVVTVSFGWSYLTNMFMVIIKIWLTEDALSLDETNGLYIFIMKDL